MGRRSLQWHCDLVPFNRSTNHESQAARKGQEGFDERTEKRCGIGRASGS